MNIFVTDIDPELSAIALDDKRVKHMPRESFEMISMAIYQNTGQSIAPFIIWNREHRAKGEKFSELFNNKCTKWTASRRENIWWLWLHSLALMKECKFRFGVDHYLYDQFLAISHWIPETSKLPSVFANASGYDEVNIYESYKQCLIHKWFVTDEIKPVYWTKRNNPKWAVDHKIFQGDLFRYNPGNDEDNFDDLPF